MDNFNDRSSEAKKFINLLENIKSGNEFKINDDINSYNICLNARWGDGKTTFIERFLKPEIHEKLYLKEQIITISAWEYDYLENPFEVIFQILDSNKKLWQTTMEVLTSIFEITKNIINNIPVVGWIPKWVNDRVVEAKNIIRKQNKINRGNILKMNDVLKKISCSFDEHNKNYEYLIIIEDLDRCKPEFAKKLIELLKHIFNSKCFIVIYVCDWLMINNMMTLNKSEQNSNEFYLDRIIDFVFTLESINASLYFFNKYLFKTKNLFKKIIFEIKVTNIVTADMYTDYEEYNYFHKILQLYSLREQNAFYYKLSKILIKQKIYNGNEIVRYPQLDCFLLKKYLNNINIEYKNIFDIFFSQNNNLIDNNDKILISECIFNILNYIERDQSFTKENLPWSRKIELSYITKLTYQKCAEIFNCDAHYKNMQSVTTILNELDFQSRDKIYLEMFNYFDKNIIMEIFNTWFKHEMDAY